MPNASSFSNREQSIGNTLARLQFRVSVPPTLGRHVEPEVMGRRFTKTVLPEWRGALQCTFSRHKGEVARIRGLPPGNDTVQS
jgi:hypothetical protein